jgi:hypothetical protein
VFTFLFVSYFSLNLLQFNEIQIFHAQKMILSIFLLFIFSLTSLKPIGCNKNDNSNNNETQYPFEHPTLRDTDFLQMFSTNIASPTERNFLKNRVFRSSL